MRVNYKILPAPVSNSQWLVIRDDVGPAPTITNSAETVVEELYRAGQLPAGRRLFYFDSEDNVDELLVVNGKFAGFSLLKHEWKVGLVKLEAKSTT